MPDPWDLSSTRGEHRSGRGASPLHRYPSKSPRLVQCSVDRPAQPVDDLGDIGCGHDVGRRHDDVVAADAVDRAGGRIDVDALVEAGFLDPLVDPGVRVEWALGAAVLDELQRLEQAAAPDIADMRMVAEAVQQGGL